MNEQLKLMAIFAHPDDEAFGTGGTLARYAHEGVEVHLVTATTGEAGQIFNPDVESSLPMSILREKELRCACQQYGLKALHLLGYVDGQTTIIPQNTAVYRIVELMRRIKPQVVISFGPDGIYGHYDHLAVHRWSSIAVQLAADTEWWPEAGPPHEVAKFYHRAMPDEQIAQMEEVSGRSAVLMDGVPFPFVGYPSEEITTVIDIEPYAEIKLRAIRCHASQLAPDMPYLQEEFEQSAPAWLKQEAYILAYRRPDIPAPTGREEDLFAGIRP